jgi:hypothetical protein
MVLDAEQGRCPGSSWSLMGILELKSQQLLEEMTEMLLTS